MNVIDALKAHLEHRAIARTAARLDYRQRKAIRRIGRGQSIGRGISADPIISRCYTQNIPEPPPLEELNVVNYCDWEAQAIWAANHTQITPYGQQLLNALNNLTPKETP